MIIYRNFANLKQNNKDFSQKYKKKQPNEKQILDVHDVLFAIA